jgi:methylated-DNA-protein-cysteine methyltransferase related protein
VSYGDVADTAGHPRQSRLVGRILSMYSDELELPWWRVVNASGRLVPGQEAEQTRLLAAEGVSVGRNGRVRRRNP